MARDTVRIDGHLIWRSALQQVRQILRRYDPAQRRLEHLRSLPPPDLDPWPRAPQPSPGRPIGVVSDPTPIRVYQTAMAEQRQAERAAEIARLAAYIGMVDQAVGRLAEAQRELIRRTVISRARTPGGIGADHGLPQSTAYLLLDLALYSLAMAWLPPEEVYAEDQQYLPGL